MGNADVSEAVKQPWKHGLVLVRCDKCINESRQKGKCHHCNDMGEYWMVPGDYGPYRVEVGELESRFFNQSPNVLMFKKLRAGVDKR